ncbi:hypothetical protein [Corallococcus terminator]|uniref:hypothetical protein n=1 Tax=Corallococcus terminator TaxID=2316733 RepID=UPI0013159EB2|nr:hypothetical protein [Corallococcus terminator]
MTRTTWFTVTGCIALGVGLFATLLPDLLLEAKGVAAGPATRIWVREVGVLLLCLAVMAFLVRNHPDSPTMRALLVGNGLVHVGLFPIEIVAWHEGVISRLSGIVPNSAVHVVLAAGFFWFARQPSGTTSRGAAPGQALG